MSYKDLTGDYIGATIMGLGFRRNARENGNYTMLGYIGTTIGIHSLIPNEAPGVHSRLSCFQKFSVAVMSHGLAICVLGV